MKEFLKTYWYWILASLLVPVILNFILLYPAFTRIVGDNTVWLSFWGTYLGAIISATIPFAILYIQRRDNERQNEENRRANDEANERNRKLQLNILKQQNETQWLNMFRQMSCEYVQLYNTNDIVEVINSIGNNPNEALNKIKQLLDRASKCNAQYTFVRREDAHGIALNNFLVSHFKIYNDVLQDIQQLVLFRQRKPEGTIAQFLDDVTVQIEPIMRQIIIEMIKDGNVIGIQPFGIAGRKRLDSIKSYMEDISFEMVKYIQVEQERIDKITEA